MREAIKASVTSVTFHETLNPNERHLDCGVATYTL